MKSVFPTILLVLGAIFTFTQVDSESEINTPLPLLVENISNTNPYWGVVSMIQVAKNRSERYVSTEIQKIKMDKSNQEKQKSINEIIIQYNYVKELFDQFIFQFTSELKLKNRLKLYKYLDKMIFSTRDEPIRDVAWDSEMKKRDFYLQKLRFAYSEYYNLFGRNFIKEVPAGSGVSLVDATDFPSLVWGIYSKTVETRTNKVDKICAVLEKLVFSAPSELIQPKASDKKGAGK